MKRILLYIIAVMLVCSACERPIEYTGKITEPKLVLQAEMGEGDDTIKAYVSRSRFFLNESYDKRVDYTMPDAVTEIQRGDQEWQPMTWSADDKAFVLPLSTRLAANEKVRIRASHPDYETITSEQTMVPRPYCQLHYFNGRNKTLWWNKAQHYVEVTLYLQNYPYNVEMMGLSINCTYYHQYKVGKRTEQRTMKTTTIASLDQLFASGGNNYENTYGFYSNRELFFKPSYKNGEPVDLRIYYDVPYGLTEELEFYITDLDINFKAHNMDDYLYWQSMLKAFGGRSDDDGTVMQNIGAAIVDLFGQEEAVQIYSNIENGYGIFGACSKWNIYARHIETVTQ
ncbi:MAG: DUF4249 domain-containing protein [Paludibacteraceae bacterium]|nr:DUF4249 domain-containing protein [Paludibacteraceae bacterium]